MNKESGSVGKQLWRGCCRGVSGIVQSICFIPSSLLAACDVRKGCLEESLPAPSSGTRLGGCAQTWGAKVSALLTSCACSLKAGTETCQGEHSACMLCGVAVVKINQEHLGALIMKACQLALEASGVTSARAAALAVQMQQQCRKALKFSHEVQCKAPSCRCHLPFFPHGPAQPKDGNCCDAKMDSRGCPPISALSWSVSSGVSWRRPGRDPVQPGRRAVLSAGRQPQITVGVH